MNLTPHDRYRILKRFRNFIYSSSVNRLNEESMQIPGDGYDWENNIIEKVLGDEFLSKWTILLTPTPRKYDNLHTIAQCISLQEFFQKWDIYSSLYDKYRQNFDSCFIVECILEYRNNCDSATISSNIVFSGYSSMPKGTIYPANGDSTEFKFQERCRFVLMMMIASIVRQLVQKITRNDCITVSVVINENEHDEMRIDNEVVDFEVSGNINIVNKYDGYLRTYKKLPFEVTPYQTTICKWLPNLEIFYIIKSEQYNNIQKLQDLSIKIEFLGEKMIDDRFRSNNIDEILQWFINFALIIPLNYNALQVSENSAEKTRCAKVKIEVSAIGYDRTNQATLSMANIYDLGNIVRFSTGGYRHYPVKPESNFELIHPFANFVNHVLEIVV